MVFLNKIHDILFDYLKVVNISNLNNNNNNNNERYIIMVLFIFIEYLIILKEDEKLKDLEYNQRMDLILSKEYIIDYLKITKIGEFQYDSLYYKILNESRSCNFKYKDYNINEKELKNLILINHNMFLVNNKLKETLNIEEEKEEERNNNLMKMNENNDDDNNIDEIRNMRKRERIRLIKYWYHYYSIYLNNYYLDFENEEILEFNWLNPNLKKLRYTLNNFPYNTKLVKNMDLKFDLNIRNCNSNSNNKDNDCIYDLGFVIPIINSRFKLAYSVLRERGFQNSKNKNRNLMNDGIKEFDDTMEEERREGVEGVEGGEGEGEERGADARTCSGFVENYSQLSESRFFNKVIDNNFIWLRNFCKNGSLQLLVNSLSCPDISIRYYSYQPLSILYEIISFHYNKYLQKVRDQEKEQENEQEQGQDQEQEQEQDEDDEDQEQLDDKDQEQEDQEQIEKESHIKEMETMNKKKRNKKQKKKHIRYIFKELPQVFMILNTLKNTVSGTLVTEHRESNSDKNDHEKVIESKHEDCIRLSSFLTRFISDSIEIIFEPENKLFKQVNYFMLSRSFLDRYDIPLLFNLLYSEDANDHNIYKSFIFNELETSIQV
ncbi:hypothetical protein, partial [Cryptosporidium hominis TU502]|uniref:hypothetical protein n=1 Tax=Cryptosporidium hominis (strain TU502) TaxID=353151 RepID=UPI0000452936